MPREFEEKATHATRQVSGRKFTTAQIVAGVIGMFLTILGGVTVARTGLTPLTGESASVMGIAMTSLMGMILLVAGISMLGASTSTYAVRGSLIGFGALAVAFGAIILIEPSPFESSLGDADSIGALLLIVGIISLIGGLTSRLISTSTVTTRSDHVEDDVVIADDAVVIEERRIPDDPPIV